MPAPPRPLLPLWARFLVSLRDRLPPTMTATFIVPALDSFGISDGEPKALVHHPLAREMITSFLLNDDDDQLWLLTRLVRSIEWELLLCNYPTATAMMDSLINRIPVLVASPSYHYLWARMLSQQGYIDRAAYHRRKALECFMPYTHDWIRLSEESTVLKLLMTLSQMRGKEDEEPTKEFLTFLAQAYDGFVRMRHPKVIGFFHCDLYHMFLEYQAEIAEEGIRPDVRFDQNSHVISVVGYHIQQGSFFGCYTLFRWILKNVTINFNLETTITQFKNIFSRHTPGWVLIEKLVGELLFAAAKNTLRISSEEHQITRHVLDHVWDLYAEAVMHAYKAGDELLITDINWMIFLLDFNVEIAAKRKRHKRRGYSMFWHHYEFMFDDFQEFWEFYSSRDDAERVGTILEQFDPILNLCRSPGFVTKLDPAWAYYYMVTGNKRGEHPFWRTNRVSFRKLDLINVVKAIDAHDEKYSELSYFDEYNMMEMKLSIYNLLEKLDEGIPLALNMVDICYEFEDQENISEAMYHYLFFKANLAYTLLPDKRKTFVLHLRDEFMDEIKRERKIYPTEDLTYKKGAMAGMFIADNWRYLRKNDGLQELYDTLHTLTKWHSTWKYKRFFKKQTRYQVEFYVCVAKYLAGYVKEAFTHIFRIAMAFTPPHGLAVEPGRTELDDQNVQLWLDWMMLALAVCANVKDKFSYGGRSSHTVLNSFYDFDYWKIASGLVLTAERAWDWGRLALACFYLGWFMQIHGRYYEALQYFYDTLEHVRDCQLYGMVTVKRVHLIPSFLKELKPDGVMERMSMVFLQIDEYDKEMARTAKIELEKYHKKMEVWNLEYQRRKEKRKDKIRGFFGMKKRQRIQKKDVIEKLRDIDDDDDELKVKYKIDQGGWSDDEPGYLLKKKGKEITEAVIDRGMENDENKENHDPNARGPREPPNEDANTRRERRSNIEQIEEERRREAIREGKKPMTGARANHPKQPKSPKPAKPPKPEKPPKAAKYSRDTKHSKGTKNSKDKKPLKHMPPRPRRPDLVEYYPELSYDLWESSQESKAWEYRRVLGSGTLWDDQENLLNELNKIIAYSAPPLDSGPISWIRELERIIRPGGGHGNWSLNWNYLKSQFKEVETLQSTMKELLNSDPRVAAPISIITATPPIMDDVYELRNYRTPGQAMIFVDYISVEDDVYIIYNIEKFAPVECAPQPACITHHVLSEHTRSAIEGWTKEILRTGLHGGNIVELMEFGRDLIKPIMDVVRKGDLVVFGNTPLTCRIPFHAIPIGERDYGDVFADPKEPEAPDHDSNESLDDLELPEIALDDKAENTVLLGDLVDIVYSHNLLVTKQCIHRLEYFQNRPKIPFGMARASFCAVAGEGTGVAAQKATQQTLRKLSTKFKGDKLSLYDDQSEITGQDLKEQAMKTFDFLHFQGEISLFPEGDKPENTTLLIAPETVLRARDITRTLQFQMGCSPLVTCIGEQPDWIDHKVRISELPDGVGPAFLQAGASGVVTTLWPVPSRIANRFTEVFYGNFLKRGRLDGDQVWNVAQELRAAASVIREENENENSHWAAFVLNGAWMRGFKPGGRIAVTKGKVVKSDTNDYRQPDTRAYPPPEFGLNFEI
ncbi:hypothetical protein TWF281_002304 [Arthrobotrys megalospora]